MGGPGNNGTGYACPHGTFCPAPGSVTPTPCLNGTYNALEGQAECTPCPASYACPEGSFEPQPCPAHAFCPVGTGAGLACPPGTFSANESSHAAPADCPACPSGSYCLDGQIAGPCAAGFWCRSGQSSPAPAPSVGYGYPVSTSVFGAPCPIGSWCPLGAVAPIACPNGTVNSVAGGASLQACLPCRAGEICYPGVPFADPCPAGAFCPAGVPAPLPCPVATYNLLPSQPSQASCLACLPGYECREASRVRAMSSRRGPHALPLLQTGIGDLDPYVCPAGLYCPWAVQYGLGCPSGTFRASPGGTSLADCANCTAGARCPFAGMAVPLPCEARAFCPASAVNAT